ncbi:MAG: hypothetical protein MUC62_08350 [Candidatus Thermoplasmatota archaeon]|jgi:hypothetical protein|nr:hypothetical protein [Candidatus Thermoplasmatota archaeon]
MSIIKVVAIGSVLLGLIGALVLTIFLSADGIADRVEPLTNWRRGSCHRYDRGGYDRDGSSSCHDRDVRSYCTYHGTYFDPDEWVDHRDYCPYYQNDTVRQ